MYILCLWRVRCYRSVGDTARPPECGCTWQAAQLDATRARYRRGCRGVTGCCWLLLLQLRPARSSSESRVVRDDHSGTRAELCAEMITRDIIETENCSKTNNFFFSIPIRSPAVLYRLFSQLLVSDPAGTDQRNLTALNGSVPR